VYPVQAPVQTAFTLQYQEIKIGTGAEAEPNKLYKVHYTGWLASDGKKFDSSYDHRSPVLDKDKKPVLDADGKPQQGDPQPLSFPQGYGRLIPGWDQGFYGMKIGGQRRLFIPWQLAYGAKGRPGPDAAHPVIPPMADLIFDVELLDVTDLPTPAVRPGTMGTGPKAQPGASAAPAAATSPIAPAATPAAPAAPASPATLAQPQSK
jgi:peptidylprolyl isomerase